MNTSQNKTADPEDNYPIIVVLDAIAKALGRFPHLKVRSYQRDFVELWGWAENPDDLLRDTESLEFVELVVVADGVPRRDNHADKNNENTFVEPLPWTLALAQAFAERKRCLVLTVLKPKIDSKNIPEPINIPFVNIHWFAATSDGLDDLYKHLKAPATPGRATRVGLQAELRRKWKDAIWSGRTALNSGHDVSNQAGAAIMSLCIYPGHAHALEAFSIKGKHERALWISVRRQYRADEPRSEGLYKDCGNVVLVDDNHAVGYTHALRELLGGAKIAAWKGVFAQHKLDSDDACSTDKLLETAWNNPQAEFHRGFKGIDLLFLDLRLWTEENNNRDTVLGRYVEVARQLATMPWVAPHIRTKLQSLSDPSKKYGQHSRLALLPIILTAIDPALPIVLFSSTRNRDVIHALRDIPNIVTNFAKPYIGSDDSEDTRDDDPAQLSRDFSAAIDIVRNLTPAKQVWLTAESNLKDGRSYVFHEDWEPIKIDLHPLTWLRNEWVLLAQRQEFTLAYAAFWQYLIRAFGPVALKIALDSGDKVMKQILEKLRKASVAPLVPLPPPDKKTQTPEDAQKLFEDVAVSLGRDFVALLKSWQKPSKINDGQSVNKEVAEARQE